MFFLITVPKSDGSDLREGGLILVHSLRVESIVGVKARQWEHEAAGHIVLRHEAGR